MGWFKRLLGSDPEDDNAGFVHEERSEAAMMNTPVKPEPYSKPRATRRTFSTLYPRETWLDLLVEDNPKRTGTQAFWRYEKYRRANSVGEALDLGITYRDIDRDYAAGNIALGLLP